MYISSDSNIWFDFFEIDHLDHPFRLKYKFYISDDTFTDEIQGPEGIREELLHLGLQITETLEDELVMAKAYTDQYRALSLHDAIALAIAKSRNWVLLTGDRQLRIAADKEKVQCHGIIWIYDKLKETGKIAEDEYHSALKDLIKAVRASGRRLPLDELEKRLGKGK